MEISQGCHKPFSPFQNPFVCFFVSQDVVPREASAASFAQAAADHSKPGPKSDLEGMSSECHDVMVYYTVYYCLPAKKGLKSI